MTSVKLLNVPFESDYKDTFHFSTKASQKAYMEGRVVKTFNDLTYQRKEQIIRIPAHIDTLYNCNYVSYVNEPYSNKTFYAFIIDMQYVNDERTDITIKTDVIQTWLFDYNVRASFVEREHVSDDSVGLHTIPEGLETGDYKIMERNDLLNLKNLCIVWGTTKTQTGANVTGDNYNGIYSGIKYYYSPQYAPLSVSEVIQKYADEGMSEAIQCVFLAPEYLVFKAESTVVQNSTTPKTFDVIEKDNRDLDGYVPKNNKLFTFPYRYLMVSNNNGGEAVYYYEKFDDTKPTFKVDGVITPGCSIRLVPTNYNGIARNDSEGLNLGKFPICNWSSDVYTNWLTQNSVNLGISVLSGVGQIVGGVAVAVATGGAGIAVGGAGVVGGVSTITNTLAQVHQQSFTPPQSQGNINCGDVVTASGANNFYFHHMTIKNEYARIIDDYFTMFGYKVNAVKIPFKAHRKSFWYTKTIDVNIDGAIPNKDLQEIKDCYNKGITFWSEYSTMGNYNADNSIIVGG